MADAVIVKWTLGEVAKVVQRFLERSVQVMSEKQVNSPRSNLCVCAGGEIIHMKNCPARFYVRRTVGS